MYKILKLHREFFYSRFKIAKCLVDRCSITNLFCEDRGLKQKNCFDNRLARVPYSLCTAENELLIKTNFYDCWRGKKSDGYDMSPHLFKRKKKIFNFFMHVQKNFQLIILKHNVSWHVFSRLSHSYVISSSANDDSSRNHCILSK